MSPGILGKKIGMTQVFRADGQVVPVTVVAGDVVTAGPEVVVNDITVPLAEAIEFWANAQK